MGCISIRDYIVQNNLLDSLGAEAHSICTGVHLQNTWKGISILSKHLKFEISAPSPESLTTSVTTLLGIRAPLIQAPIGSFSCPALAAAVSEAGGLGMLALSWDSIAGCREKLAATQAATVAPFGINLVLEWDQTERLKACLDAGVRIVSFFWGDASGYISRARTG
jgi:hypothetical protein